MSKTAIGLFADRDAANMVVAELENAGFAREFIKLLSGGAASPTPSGLDNPSRMAPPAADTGAMVGETQWLKIEGVPNEDLEPFRLGLSRGAVIVAVSSSDDRADEAARIMDRYGALDVEERTRAAGRGMSPPRGDASVQTGRNRNTSGARVFVW